MKRFLILIISLCIIPSITYAQGYHNLEKETIKVANSTGKSVVSITSVIKVKNSSQFYYSLPFGEARNDLFQKIGRASCRERV